MVLPPAAAALAQTVDPAGAPVAAEGGTVNRQLFLPLITNATADTLTLQAETVAPS